MKGGNVDEKEKDLDLAPSRRERKTLGQYILLFFLVLYTLFCALPIVLVFVAAFSDEKTIVQNGFSFIPKKWSLDGINAVLRYGKQLATSYGVTIFITVVGTLVGLLIMAMFAYSISRKDFMLGKFLSVYLLIPMLFSGGQLSCYIIYTSMYGLKDNIALLILPLCVSTMNVIILRTYIANSIPGELMEAAKIDGAGEYRTFFQITLPLLKPSMAAVGFMMATVYWNDWQNALLYITSDRKKPLQLLLINIQKSIEFLLNNSNVPASVKAAMGGTIPQYSATMATVIVVIGPIMVIYPFFQKYFVKGLTVGSDKGLNKSISKGHFPQISIMWMKINKNQIKQTLLRRTLIMKRKLLQYQWQQLWQPVVSQAPLLQAIVSQ